MNQRQCSYLDETHPALRAPQRLRARAAHFLFEEALSWTARFRLEFDRQRLLLALGVTDTAALLPTLPAQMRPGPVEIHEELLDDERRRLLRQVLSFDLEKWAEPPLNYIDRVLLFDVGGRVLLRASDNAEFLLFALPPMARAKLSERYRVTGIPEAVIKQVDIDIDEGF